MNEKEAQEKAETWTKRVVARLGCRRRAVELVFQVIDLPRLLMAEAELKSLAALLGWQLIGDSMVGYYEPSPGIESAAQETVTAERMWECIKRQLDNIQVATDQRNAAWEQQEKLRAELATVKASLENEKSDNASLREVAKAALLLDSKLDFIHNHPIFQSVWFSFANHGGDYSNGPKYDHEKAQMQLALSNLTEKGVVIKWGSVT